MTRKKAASTKKKTAKKKTTKRKTARKAARKTASTSIQAAGRRKGSEAAAARGKRTLARNITNIGKELFGQLLSQVESLVPDEMTIGIEKIGEGEKQIIHALVNHLVRNALLTRRRHCRIDAKLDVLVKYGDKTLKAETKDLSLGGMFVVSDSSISVGDDIEFELFFPEGMPPVKGRAKVVHAQEHPWQGRHPGFGLHFVGFDLDVVRNYLCKLISGEIAPFRNERRQHGRVKRTLNARIFASNSYSTAKIKDIGFGGVFLETETPLARNTRVAMTLVHPLTLQMLSLSGTVVREVHPDPDDPSRVPGVGVAFDKLSRDRLNSLLAFLNDFMLLEGDT